ncbi:hypothetical protein AB0395_04800 [Streptosporangium sp. NPDC051023]|uniref:hypothetical protein n=1 Tax=Streptosporangium sp. NPDC051023 TaxID=3155410 RepID=UPI003450DCCC
MSGGNDGATMTDGIATGRAVSDPTVRGGTAAGETGIDLTADPASRVGQVGWAAPAEELDAHGCALTPRILTPAECESVSGLYEEAGRFRSTVDMARYRFGSGQYRYFGRPFPELVGRLRQALLRPARRRCGHPHNG